MPIPAGQRPAQGKDRPLSTLPSGKFSWQGAGGLLLFSFENKCSQMKTFTLFTRYPVPVKMFPDEDIPGVWFLVS